MAERSRVPLIYVEKMALGCIIAFNGTALPVSAGERHDKLLSLVSTADIRSHGRITLDLKDLENGFIRIYDNPTYHASTGWDLESVQNKVITILESSYCYKP